MSKFTDKCRALQTSENFRNVEANLWMYKEVRNQGGRRISVRGFTAANKTSATEEALKILQRIVRRWKTTRSFLSVTLICRDADRIHGHTYYLRLRFSSKEAILGIHDAESMRKCWRLRGVDTHD